jgi:RecA-family ATPase
MGYRLWSESAGVEVGVSRLKRSGQELHGEVVVKVGWEGVKTVNGVLHQARFNFSSATTRASLGKILKGRTDGVEAFSDYDWGDTLEHLCQFVLTAERQGEPVMSMNGKMPERRTKYDIKPICPHAVVSFIYGPGGIGKSIMAMVIALSIAKGMEIVPGFAPSIKGPVLYLDWETDAYVVRERVEYVAKGHQFKATPDFYYRRCRRPMADDIEELSRIVAEKDIKFIVVDSCGPAMGTSSEYGDANEGTVKLFNAIRHLGITALVVDHVSKDVMKNRKGEVTGGMPYGSVYKVNLARSMWELVNVTQEDDDDIRVRLVNTKANDARLHEPIDLSITWDSQKEFILFSEGEDFQMQTEAFPTQSHGKPTAFDAVFALLSNHPAGLITGQIADSTGISVGYIRNLLDSDKGKQTFERDYSKSRSKPLVKLIKQGAI